MLSSTALASLFAVGVLSSADIPELPNVAPTFPHVKSELLVGNGLINAQGRTSYQSETSGSLPAAASFPFLRACVHVDNMSARFIFTTMATHKLQNYIRTHRKRSGLSQAELVYLLRLKSLSTVSRVEHFRRIPSLEVALAYEVIFRIPVRELFPGLFEQIERNAIRRVGLLARRLMEVKQNARTAQKLDSLAIAVRGTREPHHNHE